MDQRVTAPQAVFGPLQRQLVLLGANTYWQHCPQLRAGPQLRATAKDCQDHDGSKRSAKTVPEHYPASPAEVNCEWRDS